MADFTLNMTIDSDSLPLIRAAQERIVLAKPVGGGSPNVVWQSFDPFGNNGVNWTEQFGLYASNTLVINGATIRKMSDQNPAEVERYYSFTSGAVFEGPFTDARVGPGQYAAANAMPNSLYPALTFGLTQVATVNNMVSGANPLNAVSVLPNRFVTFTPITTVYVWLEANIASSTVVTNIVANQAIARYSGSTTDINLVYDPETGMFVPEGPNGRAVTDAEAAEKLGVSLFRPLLW